MLGSTCTSVPSTSTSSSSVDNDIEYTSLLAGVRTVYSLLVVALASSLLHTSYGLIYWLLLILHSTVVYLPKVLVLRIVAVQ